MECRDLLKRHNLRVTYPRREILNAVLSLKRRHFSAEDIFTYIKRKTRKVSRASTYRIVKLFSQKRLLRPIDLDKGFRMYEATFDNSHHDHLYCLKCGRIIEFKQVQIEKLQAKVCKKFGFSPLNHTLKIAGLCKGCRI